MAVEKERDKALDNAIAQIDRQFGKGSIMRMVDYGNKMQVESI
jgi:recombination protein RecA